MKHIIVIGTDEGRWCEIMERLTEREAIKTLDAMKKQFLPPTRDILDMAINALEKQIAKKPNKAIDSSWGVKKEIHVCPVCDYYLTEVHFIACHMIEKNTKVTFCEHCGQKIDWEEAEKALEDMKGKV